MTRNQEYARFRFGQLHLPNEGASSADTVGRVFLADAWLDLADETRQFRSQERRDCEVRLRRWLCRLMGGDREQRTAVSALAQNIRTTPSISNFRFICTEKGEQR